MRDNFKVVRYGPGNWREHEIEPFPEGMKPPFTEMDVLMRGWVTTVDELRTDSEVPFPEGLARVHNTFERTHPFLDGNGRTGRLLLNLILARLGYPPAIVFKNERSKYLTAMRKADAGDYGPLGELIAGAVTSTLYRFVVPAVAGPARLVPLTSEPVRAHWWIQSECVASRRQPGPSEGTEAAGWNVDVVEKLGQRVQGSAVQALGES